MTHRRPALTSIPPGILCAEDYEQTASAFLDEPTYAHVTGGSERDVTARANLLAFERWSTWPRVLADVTAGHTRTVLADSALAHPVMLAPVAYQAMFHPGGEGDTARAAAATDTALVLSTLSSLPLEDVAALAGPVRWFQLYLQPEPEVNADLVARAQAAGYTALVVTVDTPLQPVSHRTVRAGYRPPQGPAAANLARYPAPSVPQVPPGASRIFQGAMRLAPQWADIAALVRTSPLPVWVKGVLHPHDARRLADLGVAGLVVSNHGGRSLDGAPASLVALPDVRAALPRPYPLVLDGGIRRGSDVFKALALGADAVMVGRLQVCALATAGALGVAHMVKLLREELEACMALAGCATLADITPGALLRGQ